MKKIRLSVEKEGFDGSLYPVGNRKDKILIVMSGSEGGEKHAGKLADYFQKRGFPAIAIGYFKTKGTGKELSRIPAEYIEKVVMWLTKQGYQKIAIEGVSKGAEYALACAIAIPAITCVILKTPSWFYSEGLKNGEPSGTSCWSYRGSELPFTPYKIRNFSAVKMILQAKEFNILPVNKGKVINRESIIPVEKVNGPILIFSTKADTVWPSAHSGKKLEERLFKKQFKFSHKHICFSYMSHMMLENAGREVRLCFKSERKHAKECAIERKRMGDETINWLENVWK